VAGLSKLEMVVYLILDLLVLLKQGIIANSTPGTIVILLLVIVVYSISEIPITLKLDGDLAVY
jgi:hypothetical protein